VSDHVPPDEPGPAESSNGVQPHDSLFKRVISVPVNAASLVRVTFPAELVERLDLANLELVPGSFVDESLNSLHSDVLMRTRLDGEETLVYALMEHQSSPDPLMAFRMLRYMMRVWDGWLEGNKNAKRLPLILPLVVYQGDRRWTHPTELRELIDVPRDLAGVVEGFVPRFRFVFEDLTRLDAAALRAWPVSMPVWLMARLFEVVRVYREDVTVGLDDHDVEAFRGLQAYDDWWESTVVFMTYIQRASKTPLGRLESLAARIGPEAKEAVVTTAEKLRAEGRAEATAKATAKAVLAFLEARDIEVPDDLRARIISCTDLELLDAWVRRAATVESAGDLFTSER
jgi:hypothetical protein